MTEEEIRKIVRQTIIEERMANAGNSDAAMLKTVSAILTAFGLEEGERKDIAEDFRYLRRWRLGAERVQGVGLTALVTVLVGGFLSALWLGTKALIGK